MSNVTAIALLLAAALVAGCAGEAPPTGGGAAESSARDRSGRGPGAPAGGIPDDVDLQALATSVPEYEGRGRNLFAFGTDPTPEPAPWPSVTPPAPQPTPPPTPPARPAPSARVDVKYAGFLEKTEANGSKAKYAIFLDGNEILAAAEGERVANRFTVVEIGLESVTISTPAAGATQRIPLQAN